MASSGQRQYDLIVLGATGYTGRYTCEHITTSLPVDLKWAVAGRSRSKLDSIVADLKQLLPDRKAPGIETAQLQKDDLVELAKKTRVLISTVGPYHKYGTPVFEACAETGTHYLDCTGEVPWVYDMIQKYDETAQRNGAIMIPQNGIESAPADLMVWGLASHIKQALGQDVGLQEVVDSCHVLEAQASGGTLATVLTLFDKYSLSHLQKSARPWSLAPILPKKPSPKIPLSQQLTGLTYVPDLGQLTDSIQASADIPIINRSWALLDQGKFYGPNFRVSIYSRTRNVLTGFAMHMAITFGFLAILIPPVRWLLKRFVFQPGEGPSRDAVKNDYVEWRAIATADTTDPNDPKHAYGRMSFQGSMYWLTGICLAEAAMTLLKDETVAHGLKGGVLTPATLGAPYLERLQKAGLKVEFKMLP